MNYKIRKRNKHLEQTVKENDNNKINITNDTKVNKDIIPGNTTGINPLVTKKERFVNEYLIDLRIHEAGVRAGYKSDTHVYKIIREKETQDRISYLMFVRSKRTEVTQDRIIEELASIAFFNIKDIHNLDGTIKKLDSISRRTASAIASIDLIVQKNRQGNETGILKKIKLESKLIALEKLAKHLGMFQENSITDPALYELKERKNNLENLNEKELLQLSELTEKAIRREDQKFH